MPGSSDWKAKAAEYAISAKKITDVDLRRQYAELAARCLDVAKKLEDARMSVAPRAGRPSEN